LLSSLKLHELGLPQPAAGILISPWVDMALSSFEGGNALVETDYVVTANDGLPLATRQFVGGVEATSPEVNPLYCPPSDFSHLPPQLVLVGGGDFVLPECRDLARVFTEAGIRFNMVVEQGEFHLYALGSKWIKPETRSRTNAAIVSWVADALKNET
jgi:monoterpene epsilon-lactone hydrolase